MARATHVIRVVRQRLERAERERATHALVERNANR
jgi:hypothetical protein